MNILSVTELNYLCKNTLIDHLGIEFIHSEEQVVKATMPVDQRTMQPLGRLHGGAVMALVETVGSVGSFNLVDRERYEVVGMEINGNHVGHTRSSLVYATATLKHKGSRTHVWAIDVFDDENKPVSICRMTTMIIEKTAR